MFSLKGKNAVVTGAGSGIGQAIALAFAKQGARVDVLEINTEAAGETVEKIRSEGGEANAVECDVTRHDHVQEVFDKLGIDRGGLDCLINNAGIAHVGNITNTSEADFDRVMSVNLKGVFNCLKGGVQQMLKSGGGSIVNIASTVATMAINDRLAYSTSKGGVLAMTYAVAKDHLHDKIRCNAIQPGRIHTPFVDGFIACDFASAFSVGLVLSGSLLVASVFRAFIEPSVLCLGDESVGESTASGASRAKTRSAATP